MIALSSTSDQGFGDFVQPFQIEAPGLRGRLVRLDATLDGAMAAHDYPAPVARLLAEAMAMAAVLASGLKFDGVFSLQIHGDGPVGLLMSDVTSAGGMRGYARVDADRLEATDVPPAGGGASPVPRLLGAGHMAFTIDQGPETDRYQGITEIEGATLADCAHTYFRRSEQLETAITLCSSEAGSGRRAAALMLQRLPPTGTDEETAAAEDDWRRAVVLMSSVTSAELLADDLSAADVLYRLFHEDGVRVFTPRPLHHDCRCSRAKVERTLRSFPRAEIEGLADADGLVRVTCEFCKEEYAFDAGELDSLYRETDPMDRG